MGNCIKCGAVLLEHVSKCPSCAPRLSAPDLSEFEEKPDVEFLNHAVKSSTPGTLLCPRCNKRLAQVTFEDGLVVDACGTCAGAWYDLGEMERALHMMGESAVGEAVFKRSSSTEKRCAICAARAAAP